MNILLIEPPFHRFMGFYRHYYPLGLAYIASTLNQEGHKVRILDAEHDRNSRTRSYPEAIENYPQYLEGIRSKNNPIWQELRQEISTFQPDLVGISVLTVKLPSALMIASICNEVCKDAVVAVGGEHPTVRSMDLLQDDNIDFVIRGEGEKTTSELVKVLINGGRLENLEGLSFKSNGRVVHNKDRELIKDLNILPWPARDLLSYKETYRPIDFGLVMGSRGCPYNCAFCPNKNIWGSKTRYRTIDNIIDEIKSVKQIYSTNYFSFRDYSFSSNNQWTREICQSLIKEKLEIGWECATRPDLVDEEIISLMKKSGCFTFRIGIESGSERILKVIRKDLSVRRIREAAKILNRQKVYWAAYFMFGLPSETEEDIKKTLQLIDEIDPPFVTVARFTPLPGTELYETLKREGRIDEQQINWGEWGNQWLGKNFSKGIDDERFMQIMTDIAEKIDERNRRNQPEKGHPLLRAN